MKYTKVILLATAGSTCLLAGAFIFQAMGYAPCKMCYWQRYPHIIAICAGLIALTPIAPRLLTLLGAAAAATTASIGVFHAGVEQKWWEGPSSCTGGGAGLQGLSGDALLSTNVVDKVVMCDEISWAFLGLSMPSWNAILSFILCAIWLYAMVKSNRNSA